MKRTHTNNYKPNTFKSNVKHKCRDCGYVWFTPRLEYAAIEDCVKHICNLI